MDSALQRVYADVFGTEASELDAAAWPERCIPGLTFPTVPGLVLHKQTLDTDQQVQPAPLSAELQVTVYVLQNLQVTLCACN
jgi:hypothetical protein